MKRSVLTITAVTLAAGLAACEAPRDEQVPPVQEVEIQQPAPMMPADSPMTAPGTMQDPMGPQPGQPGYVEPGQPAQPR